MMSDKIKKMLEQKEMTPLHTALLRYCEDLLVASRRSMASQYPMWDKQADVYMRRMPANKDDIEAVKQGLPRRIVVPLSYSQVNTFVAFGFMLYTQRDRFFELTPVEGQDDGMRECCELVLQRDQDATNYKQRLVNNLLNIARFGMGVEVDWWDVETAYIPIETPVEPTMMNGVPTNSPPPITKLEKVTKREGNCIRTISPYRIFLDPGFHPTEWQRGSFVGWDDEFSRNALLGLQADGVVLGVNHVSPYDPNRIINSGRGDGTAMWSRFSGIKKDSLEKASTICVTQLVVNLIPKDVKVSDDGETLGPEAFPHKWLIWIANDERIIRAEPLPNAHAQWPVSISFFAPDQHESVFNSLAYMIDDLQSLVSWFLNARVAAVSRTIDNQFVADPMGINMDDLATKKRIIRMTKAGAGKDVRRYLTQLQVTDTTQGHVADVKVLTEMLQLVSGVNENAMGQYTGGRRSATESRTVTQGAASRMKMVLDFNWSIHYQPQANRCLINARQGMSPEEFAIVCGPTKATQYYDQFHAPVQVLARTYDYLTFDGASPSDKQFIAQQLMEVFTLLMQAPQTALAFNMDPQKVMDEIMTMRGLHAKAFEFDSQVLEDMQAQQQQMMQQQAAQPTQENVS